MKLKCIITTLFSFLLSFQSVAGKDTPGLFKVTVYNQGGKEKSFEICESRSCLFR